MKGNTVLNLGVDMVESGTVCGTPSHTFDWDQIYIPLDKIDERPGFNPRKDYGEHDGTFAALVESIRDRGMLELPRLMPVVDKRGDWDPVECRFTIVAGHRRIAAAKVLGWESVRACVPDADGKQLAQYDDGQQLIDALVENLQRRDLNCIDVAEGIARLEKLGNTQEQIAGWIGRDQGRVSKTVRLLTLPGNVLVSLRCGELSASHGEELLPLVGSLLLDGEIEAIGLKAVQMGLTKEGLRNVVKARLAAMEPKQEIFPMGDYALAHNSDTDEFDDRVARTLAATKGMDKEPKPTPKDDNGLTRKDADASFAAAMSPDPDVVRLADLPAPSEEHPRVVLGKWLHSAGLNWIEAAEKLRDIIEPNEEELGKPGMWFRLEPETAQKLMELCDWHKGELGNFPMQEKLNIIVGLYHQLKTEGREL